MVDLLSTLPVEWKTWGLLIIFGFPLSIVITGEILLYLEKKESRLTCIVHNVRNILLPALVTYLIFSKIMKLGDDSIFLKISATLFWLILIYTSLKFVNILVFSDALPKSVRARLPKLLIDFLRTFLVLLGAAIIASNVWGADLGRLLTALGVGSVVLGLALQDVLGGLFSGIALLSSKPFTTGDWIGIGDMDGRVESIDWRAVSLINFEGDLVVVPNSVIAKERFKNYSRPNPIHRESVPFDISFDDPPNKVKQVLLEAAMDTKGILSEPAPQVVLISYDEFSIRYEVRYFINNYANIASIYDKFITKIWYTNKRYGITFPTRSHEVYNFEGDKGEDKDSSKVIYKEFKNLKVFSVPDAHLLILTKHCKIDDFGVGECILQRGLVTEYFYVILDGIALERVENKNAKELYENRLKRGDLFGLSSLVRKEASLVSVSALSDLRVITIEIEAMKNLLQKNPQVAESLENMVNTSEKKIAKSMF